MNIQSNPQSRRTVMTRFRLVHLPVVGFLTLTLAGPQLANAHCDTLDGPVGSEARAALASADVTPVLKWVQPADEPAIRAAFAESLKARALGTDAAAVADRWFFETLVRVHRAGEGAPYTGLAPAGTVEPGIAAADAALKGLSIDELVTEMVAHATEGLRHRFERVLQTQQHAGESVEKGRAYVAAYVEFIHYVEGLHLAIEKGPAHAHAPAESH